MCVSIYIHMHAWPSLQAVVFNTLCSSVQLGITNWMPVSFRIPTPADAKLAPTSSLSPSSSGLRYGSRGSEPRCSPALFAMRPVRCMQQVS
uniref:Uncharacterized protein n=1 Tax=Arundo donax TaxID=35708 RepID=A0A0A9EED4_ARUDO